MEQTKPKSSMAKFRRQYPRFDYYPEEKAMAAIQRLRKANPCVCTREIIDALVVRGGQSFFPEISGK